MARARRGSFATAAGSAGCGRGGVLQNGLPMRRAGTAVFAARVFAGVAMRAPFGGDGRAGNKRQERPPRKGGEAQLVSPGSRSVGTWLAGDFHSNAKGNSR